MKYKVIILLTSLALFVAAPAGADPQTIRFVVPVTAGEA
jgi:hypothetical protein